MTRTATKENEKREKMPKWHIYLYKKSNFAEKLCQKPFWQAICYTSNVQNKKQL